MGRVLAGLDEAGGFEELVDGSETAREGDQGSRAKHEVELAQGEVPELEAQLRHDVRIGLLLPGQGDVEAGRRSARSCEPPLAGNSRMPGETTFDVAGICYEIEVPAEGNPVAERWRSAAERVTLPLHQRSPR